MWWRWDVMKCLSCCQQRAVCPMWSHQLWFCVLRLGLFVPCSISTTTSGVFQSLPVPKADYQKPCQVGNEAYWLAGGCQPALLIGTNRESSGKRSASGSHSGSAQWRQNGHGNELGYFHVCESTPCVLIGSLSVPVWVGQRSSCTLNKMSQAVVT